MRTPNVQELMQRDVMVVNPDTPLLDIHRLFVEEEINGAPVVDDNSGLVVGVISSLDLLRAVRDEYDHVAPVSGAYFRDEVPGADPDWLEAPADFAEAMSTLKVSDAMERRCVSVGPTASVAEVARLMRSQRIHRVLVINEHELVGILTSFDLLQLLTDEGDRAPRGAKGSRVDPVC